MYMQCGNVSLDASTRKLTECALSKCPRSATLTVLTSRGPVRSRTDRLRQAKRLLLKGKAGTEVLDRCDSAGITRER